MSKYKILNGASILERYHKTISGIRTGRVNSNLLDNIMVDMYGSKMPVAQLAVITLPEAMQILITPFDKSSISAISKAISDSNLGVSPVDDGIGVRLAFPPMTEENRKKRVKDLHSYQEDARKEVRVKRQDAIKHKKNEDGISEDEIKRFENNIQNEVDMLNTEIEELTKAKEKEIMTI